MTTFGVVGNGFVGGALYHNFNPRYPIEVYDVDASRSTVPDLRSLVDYAEVIFVCVPTPMSGDRSCDTSIVRKVVKQIAEIRTDRIVVIKSTVVPGTTASLAEETGMRVGFNPEFLTERNAFDDFRNQPLVVLGFDFDPEASALLYGVFRDFNPASNVQLRTTREAELFKYVANSFLATKVIFANELRSLCEGLGMDYENIASLARMDERLGKTHWQVPGPDGKFGYGGTCFPKDTNAITTFARGIVGAPLTVIEQAMAINDLRRN